MWLSGMRAVLIRRRPQIPVAAGFGGAMTRVGPDRMMHHAPPVRTGTVTPHARLFPPHRRTGTLAIYIKTTFHDLQPFTYLQEDLRQFCKVAGPVVISVPDDHMTAFRAHVFSGYELMSDSAVARSANVYWPI